MRSIKRGRGPSMMNCVGSILAAIFGVVWTIIAINMGAPFFFPIFGIIFVIVGIVQAAYNYKNATGKNRFSEFDITEENGEYVAHFVKRRRTFPDVVLSSKALLIAPADSGGYSAGDEVELEVLTGLEYI